MDRMRLVLLVVAGFFLATIVSTATADCPRPTPQVYIGLTESYVGDCAIQTQFPVTHVSVAMRANSTFKGRVRFKLADPPAGISIWQETWATHTGDRLTGMEFDIGCSGGSYSFVLGSLDLLTLSTVPCTLWGITNVEVVDCNGNPLPMEALYSEIGSYNCLDGCFQNCTGLPPYDLSPPDGATGVPLNVVFSWYAEGGYAYPPNPYLTCTIRVGKLPNCSDAQVVQVPCTIVNHGAILDFLQPGTKYYWVAEWRYASGGCSSGDWGTSMVQSFTTAGPLAVEPITWGRVKAMYRE